MKNKKFFPRLFRFLPPIFVLAVFLFVGADSSAAATRAEFAAKLFAELEYKMAGTLKLPPDVPASHRFAKQIGSSAAYGLISEAEFFSPDEVIDRRGAVYLSLQMMGWRREASLYESLTSLPDLSGTGDTVFFLAAEMKPPAPSGLLLDGFLPLSEGGETSLIAWVRSCKRRVYWNRVFSYEGTDLIIYRQGMARPGEPNEPDFGNPVGSAKNEPLYVAAIAVHPGFVDTRIAFAEPVGMERIPPSDFSLVYEPIGMINGGFFSGGRPLGTMLLDGVHAGKPLPERSAVGWNNADGVFVFGRGDARVGLRTPSGYVEFTRFNSPPPQNEAALYTPDVALNSAGIGLDAIQIIVRNGSVAEIREASFGGYAIPEKSYMIVARGRSRTSLGYLRPGDVVEIRTDWATGSFAACTNLIQAGPMLIREDRFVTSSEAFKDDILKKRHPRTIMGTDGRRMIWAVIDGRSSIHSRGATIDETRWIARSLGLKTALNMDGGGSSQLMWRGVPINSPSDGKERPLPYVVMMMPRGAQMVRRNIFPNYGVADQGEPGIYNNANADADGMAAYMDTYSPRNN
ncbi:MAG: phosphodiester glycosidase family protein [Synergistaceae bacterium]|jgi:hypothetical protein|nr:phosphodiester glycosidase family protein [Synergistaceae bacterium]